MESTDISESSKLTDFVGGKLKKSFCKQYYATFCLNLLGLSYGAFCGWPSAAIPILKSDKTPLKTGPISSLEASWIASIMCLGGFVGNFIFGWIAQRIGKKKTLLIVSIPQMSSWLLIYLANNASLLLVSRFLGGFAGGGIFGIVPSYISEISDDKLRGGLGSTVVFSCNFGILFAYILGDTVSYSTSPLTIIPLSLMFVILFANVPDSPISLVQRQIYDEAEKSIIYFRNIKRMSKLAHQEILEEMKRLQSTQDEEKDKITFNDLKQVRVKKALLYGIGLMALNQATGVFAMLNFTASIFKESGSNVRPNVASIIVGVIQIFGSIFPTLLVDRLGRKVMMTISSIGTGLGLFTLAIYSYLKEVMKYDVEKFNFLPLVALSFTIFIANWGILTLTFMILSEICESKIRGFATVTCMSFLWIFAYLAIMFITPLIDVFGMHGAMFIFSINAFIGAIFVCICLPETKGKSFEEIVELLERRRH